MSSAPSSLQESQRPPSSPAVLLVVDDEPDLEMLIRQRFRAQIREKRYEFVFARNGVEALRQLEGNPEIAVVLSDINMPQMDGLTLLKRIGDCLDTLPAIGQEARRELKAVMVSAYGDMSNIRSAMNLGAFDFLTKPIDLGDLETTISKTLREVERLRQASHDHEQLAKVERELLLASRIQKALLPTFREFEERKEFEIHAAMVPARAIGGDFYDSFLLDQDHLALVIADVCGKGVAAAIFMAFSRAMLRACAMQIHEPGACLEQLNRLLLAETAENIFVTMQYAVLDLRSGSLSYTCAGHSPACRVSADRLKTGPCAVEELEAVGGPVLGILPDAKFPAGSVQLRHGDTLFFFTDGVTEAMHADGSLFESDRLCALLAAAAGGSPRELVEEGFETLKDFTFGAEQSDDITMMAVRFLSPGHHQP